MFEIELDIFSGRPNPRWTLDPAEEGELITRLLDRTVPLAPVDITDGRLGYRGFVVRAPAPPRRRWFPAGCPPHSGCATASPRRSTQQRDLAARHGRTPDGPRRSRHAAVVGSRAAACKKPYHTSSTDFRDWNRGLVCYQNNCYNYGSNWRTDTYAQPGRGSGTGLAA